MHAVHFNLICIVMYIFAYINIDIRQEHMQKSDLCGEVEASRRGGVILRQYTSLSQSCTMQLYRSTAKKPHLHGPHCLSSEPGIDTMLQHNIYCCSWDLGKEYTFRTDRDTGDVAIICCDYTFKIGGNKTLPNRNFNYNLIKGPLTGTLASNFI